MTRSGACSFSVASAHGSKFTGKERDSESGPDPNRGLDNFGTRYYGSSLGRFMQPDPLLNSGRPWNPQSWNRYAYVMNDPVSRFDPDGLFDYTKPCGPNDALCQENHKRFEDSLARARQLANSLAKGSKERAAIERALDAIGAKGDKNGVTVAFGPTTTGAPAETVDKEITIDYAQLSRGW